MVFENITSFIGLLPKKDEKSLSIWWQYKNGGSHKKSSIFSFFSQRWPQKLLTVHLKIFFIFPILYQNKKRIDKNRESGDYGRDRREIWSYLPFFPNPLRKLQFWFADKNWWKENLAKKECRKRRRLTKSPLLNIFERNVTFCSFKVILYLCNSKITLFIVFTML